MYTAKELKRWYLSLKRTDIYINNNRDNGKSDREVFVRRTTKHLEGKCIKTIQYDVFDNPYYFYLKILGISLVLDWGRTNLNIHYLPVTNSFISERKYGQGLSNVFHVMKMSYNELLDLEYTEISIEEFDKLRKNFIVDLPQKQYVYECWNIKKPSLQHKEYIIKAKTQYLAEKERLKVIENPTNNLILGKLIKIIK